MTRTSMKQAGDSLRQTDIEAAGQGAEAVCRDSFSMDELRAIALHMGVRNSGEIIAREDLMDEIRRLLSEEESGETASMDGTPRT